MNQDKIARWLRRLVLAGLLGYVTYAAYLHQVLGGRKAPSVHALCPYGALESLYSLLFAGGLIQKVFSGTVVLLVLTVVLAILFRRSFCGLLCPFGALQELVALTGQKLFRRRFTLPDRVDRPLRYLKYVILVLTTGMAWYYGKLWMAPYDPYAAYGHITTLAEYAAEKPENVIGVILLVVTLAGSLLYDRFFCKYLCPAGAFYAVIGKLSPTKIERNAALCIQCKLCNKACPVNIDVAQATVITTAECLNCNECVVTCPRKGALAVKTAKKPVQPVVILAFIVMLFFGTILVAQATGNFQVMPSGVKKGEGVSLSEVKPEPQSIIKEWFVAK
ncbi:MAG: 4Fe-4S binding protein [Heliobacteriaceae bacterium]|nr:4Fe-4S binding protein [Heliobacteriaceae bacterium]